MQGRFGDPIDELAFIAVSSPTLHLAERMIFSCEHGGSDAEIPFDWLLAEVTGKRGAYEFILTDAARCRNCLHSMTEKTLVKPL